MAWPEQRICGVTVECGGRMGAGRVASTIMHVIGREGSRVHVGVWLLVVIVVRLTKSHWKHKSISLGAKRVSCQEVSPVALTVTRYPMLIHTRN